MKNKLLKPLLFFFTMMLGLVTGAGIYETVAAVPIWMASTKIAPLLASYPELVVHNERFFIVATPLTALLALLSLIFGWKASPSMRFWLRLSTVIFLLVFVITAVYFVPEQLTLRANQPLPEAEFASRASRWTMLNYLRAASLVVALFAALKALSLSGVPDENQANKAS